MIRNITFQQDPVAAVCDRSTDAATEDNVTLRTRTVTLSPAEEYQLRGGEVRPISNELAAAILSFKGRAAIGNKGVTVDRKDIGGRFVYFHENSITINDFSSRERKLFYVINRLTPEVLHLLDETGVYIESLPLRERPAVLDTEAQQEQLRQNKTIVNRAASRLQALHGENTREALATLAANSNEMQRVVQTLPAPGSAPAPPMQPSRNGSAERIATATREIQLGTHDRTSASSRDREASTRDVLTRRSKQTECPF